MKKNTYGNCSYHAKDKSTDSTDEVLITNYSVNVDLGEPGTDKTVETLWHVGEDGSMNVLENKVV